jgi:acyl-CoA synthetase (AMP-forming)/AMP-acid ligase II
VSGDLISESSTLVEMLQRRVEVDPARMAFAFVEDGRADPGELSFAELDLRARAIAARLRELDATGERVLLMFPSGLDYVAAFYGCLYANAIAVPAYPPDPRALERSLPRLMAIVNDCQPKVMLTVSAFLPVLSMIRMQTRVARVGAKLPLPERFGRQRVRDIAEVDSRALFSAKVVAVDRLSDAGASSWRAPSIRGEDLAYLQYTSGSTSAPKGVMVRHQDALENLRLGATLLNTNADDVAVGWVPLYHDLGLVCYVLGTAYSGLRTILLSPLEFLARPALWLETISKYRGSTNAGPNFAFDLCVRKTNAAQRASLDLSCWKVAGNGGEPVRPATLRRFVDAFGPCGFEMRAFHPTLGLAEATLFVTLGKPRDRDPTFVRVDAAALARGEIRLTDTDDDSGIEMASCGVTSSDHDLAIVGPDTRARRGDGELGEIWFSGPTVPEGYWAKPDASRETFQAELADDPRKRRYLRTGDLGFTWAGELFVAGRIKDLVIVRGRNHYPQDIELSAQAVSDELRPGCGAAFSLDSPKGEGAGEDADEDAGLVLVQELRAAGDKLDFVGLAGQIRAAVLRDFELPIARVVFVGPRSIPKTSSGKVQRRACRDGLLAGRLTVVASV